MSEVLTREDFSSVLPTTETPTESTPSEESPSEIVLPDLPDPGFLARQCFVYDVDEQRYLYLSGNERIIYPASTIKLLTILYAETLVPMDLVITPGNELELVGENSSFAYRIHLYLTRWDTKISYALLGYGGFLCTPILKKCTVPKLVTMESG